MRRGVTLLEVVLATALLAAVAAAGARLFVDAQLRLAHRDNVAGVDELARVANAAINSPEAVGLPGDWLDQVATGRLELTTDDGDVVVYAVRMHDDRLWVGFRRRDLQLARCMPLDQDAAP